MPTTIPTRKIGDTEVPQIGLGAMALAAAGGAGVEEGLKVLDAAFESGCTFWDTADIYGDSEELIGEWFKRTGKRSKVFLATKFGFDMTALSGVDGSPGYAKRALNRSLKKLGTDYVDLYYLHRADRNTPIEKTVSAMAQFVRDGRVRHLGLSDVSASTLRRAHAVHPIAAVQVEYSPFALEVESEKIGLLQTCRQLGVAVVAYSPLGRGLANGKYKSIMDFGPTDFRRHVPTYQDDFERICGLAEHIRHTAHRFSATPAQICLAWLLEQGTDVFVIPGTKRIEYIKENARAAHLQLNREDILRIRELAEKTGAEADSTQRFIRSIFVNTPPLKNS